jgi:hypothetical protein
MTKYEQLIEFIINEQEDKARELFHQIVVEKSREIYENLIDEEDLEENGMEAIANDVEQEDIGMVEADDELGPDMGGDDMEMDADMGGDDMDADMGGDDMGGEGELEDRVMDLEAALDELKAEFDALMADEEGEAEHNDGEGDPEFGGDDAGEDDLEMPKESMVREYVDKVATPSNAEGQTVGAQSSSKPTVNTKSPNGPGANMGGHANLAKGGAEQAPDGKPTPQPNNQYAKGKGNLPHAGQFENVPGAKTKGYTAKAGAKHNEGSTTDGSVPVAKHSPVAK